MTLDAHEAWTLTVMIRWRPSWIIPTQRIPTIVVPTKPLRSPVLLLHEALDKLANTNVMFIGFNVNTDEGVPGR